MRRLPIRLRLTIAFAGVLAVVLAAAGGLLFREFADYLDQDIASELDARVRDTGAVVAGGGAPGPALARSGERFAEVFGADGRLIASTRTLGRARLLTPSQARRAAKGGARVARVVTPAGPVRVRAVPLVSGARPVRVVAVADSLGERDQALQRLRLLLLIAGPAALLLATYAGHNVARAALLPVERMRRRAERITDRNVAGRLPVPATHDEIEALGHTLNELLARLDTALQRERRLLSDASHELRTPLTVMRAEIQLALRGERSAGDLRAALESVGRQSDRLRRLAEDLLVFARANQGHLPIRSEPLGAQALLEGAARRGEPAAQAAGRAVTVRGSGDVVLMADADRAAQAVDNLIANALAHGGGDIELEARRSGERVELHVIDGGDGFPPELLDHAFERFTRSDEALAREGSGLGLAIVAAIAQAHGGEAGARNRPEGGADVWLSLPAHRSLIPAA